MSENKELYLNFDEYIRQGEPAQREKAGYWQAAIGLQAVDGLKVSGCRWTEGFGLSSIDGPQEHRR